MAHASGASPATSSLDRAHVAYRSHTYTHDPTIASYGLEAAAALGVPAERVFKTLVVETGAGLAVCVVPVGAQLDLKAAARALGVKRVTMATPVVAERSSGMVIGGISPIGQKRRLPTVVDASAQLCDTVFVSGGRRGFDIELAPADLIAMTTAMMAPIARSGLR